MRLHLAAKTEGSLLRPLQFLIQAGWKATPVSDSANNWAGGLADKWGWAETTGAVYYFAITSANSISFNNQSVNSTVFYGGDGMGNDLIPDAADNGTQCGGDGHDIVVPVSGDTSGSRLVLGAGITPDSVTLSLNGSGDLQNTLAGGADNVLLKQYLVQGVTTVVDSIQFADGTVWHPQQVLQKIYEAKVTAGDDSIVGIFTDDALHGGMDKDSIVIKHAAGNSAQVYCIRAMEFSYGCKLHLMCTVKTSKSPDYASNDAEVHEMGKAAHTMPRGNGLLMSRSWGRVSESHHALAA